MSEIAPVDERLPRARNWDDGCLGAPMPWSTATGTARALALAAALPALDLFERLAAIRAHLPGRIVFTTSFGLEDQAITPCHFFCDALAIDVATLDTGRLFPETHEVWAETERRYGRRITAFAPAQASLEALVAQQGIGGLRSSLSARLDCCSVRKVAPLESCACRQYRLDHRHSRRPIRRRARLLRGCVRRTAPPGEGEPAV